MNVKGVSAYTKSKTIAERAAWDFVAKILQLNFQQLILF